jgi:hypothetical protein
MLSSTLHSLKHYTRKHPYQSGVLAAVIAASFVPIITMAVLLRRYSVNVPFWDQWEYVPLIYAAHHGTLTIHDLWMQHNEHRILFPRVVTIIASFVTGYNIRYEILLNFVTATLSYSVLLVMLKRTFGRFNKTVVALAFLFAWILYSPIQWINWIWGFQLAFFMCVLFSVLTIHLVSKTESKRYHILFYLSVITATVATYSLGNGIVVWFVGLAMLLLQRADRRKLIIWTSSAVVVGASYLYHFRRSPGSLPLSTVIREPILVSKYALGYLGRNLALTGPGARLTGLVLLVILVGAVFVVYKHGQLKKIVPWLGLVVVVIFTALLAAASRLNFGLDQSLVDSYTTISLLFILSVLVVVFYAVTLLLQKTPPKRLHKWYLTGFFVAGLISYALVSSFVSNYFSGLHQLEDQGRDMSKVQRCVYSATSPTDNCLLFAYPSKQIAWNGIQTLKELKWGNFNKANR